MAEDSDPIPLGGGRRDTFGPWARRVTDKVLLPLMVLFIAGVTTSAVGTWVAVARLTDGYGIHAGRISHLENRQESLVVWQRTAEITDAEMRGDLRELRRRVEQLEGRR